MQIRFAIDCTSDQYVKEKRWQDASLNVCPEHSSGGCGFSRHGTYERLNPPGTRIARWYCPLAGQTYSLLPDCLASHYRGSLSEIEALVVAVEQSRSLESVAQQIRPEVELPGVIRFLRRRCSSIRRALHLIKGLFPDDFAAVEPTVMHFWTALEHNASDSLSITDSVLMTLRSYCQPYLHRLPTPFGFSPTSATGCCPVPGRQQPAGPDPPASSG